MPRIHEQFRKCVAFLIAETTDSVTQVLHKRPIGTAFFIGVTPAEFDVIDPTLGVYPYWSRRDTS